MKRNIYLSKRNISKSGYVTDFVSQEDLRNIFNIIEDQITRFTWEVIEQYCKDKFPSVFQDVVVHWKDDLDHPYQVTILVSRHPEDWPEDEDQIFYVCKSFKEFQLLFDENNPEDFYITYD